MGPKVIKIEMEQVPRKTNFISVSSATPASCQLSTTHEHDIPPAMASQLALNLRALIVLKKGLHFVSDRMMREPENPDLPRPHQPLPNEQFQPILELFRMISEVRLEVVYFRSCIALAKKNDSGLLRAPSEIILSGLVIALLVLMVVGTGRCTPPLGLFYKHRRR